MHIRISRERTPYLYDQKAAFGFLRSVRWSGGRYCPTCRSRDIHQVQTIRVLELFRCRECGYTFNTTSRSFFAGSYKVPSKLQLILLHSVREFRWTNKDLSRAVALSTPAVAEHLAVLDQFTRLPMTVIDTFHAPAEKMDDALAFLEQPAIKLDEHVFAGRIAQLLVPDTIPSSVQANTERGGLKKRARLVSISR